MLFRKRPEINASSAPASHDQSYDNPPPTIVRYGEYIGRGTFGDVRFCFDKQDRKYAAKTFTYRDTAVHLTTIREIKALKKLKHKNVVEILKVEVRNDKVNVIFPYYATDLFSIKEDFFPVKNRISHIRGVMRQIIEGVIYIHSNGFIHRDLKTANLMIEKINLDEGSSTIVSGAASSDTQRRDARYRCPYIIKIIDFGMSRLISREMTTNVVTLWYRAPELLNGVKYSYPVDVWSIGCIFLELLQSKAAFQGHSEVEQLTIITAECKDNGAGTGKFKSKYCNLNADALDLIEKMLTMDPTKRIGLKDALSHEFFTEYV